MVFLVETINICCDGFIVLFFSVGHKPISYTVVLCLLCVTSHDKHENFFFAHSTGATEVENCVAQKTKS